MPRWRNAGTRAHLCAVPWPTEPVSAIFGGEVELIGYDLATQNDALDLTLYWHAPREPERDYKFFVHVVDPASETVVAQADYMPQNWSYATGVWVADEYVPDQLLLPMAGVAAGTYEIYVGLYNPDDGTRLATDPATATNAFQITMVEWP